jgi:acetyl-CoA carboxylase carboxyl transferase beta subunit
MSPVTAREWLDLVLDPGYGLLFEDVVSGDPLNFPGYAEQLRAAREKTGCSEAVLVAEGTIGDDEAIVISFEFGFLGGSMGVAAGERICRAFERAAEKRVRVIALAASGGARMQEGMLALAQMPATLIAREKLAAARQLFICYLRNPTTGGVYASFASSADLLWAEPGATIGFAGPRVAESMTGQPLPEGSHTAESASKSCLVDEIISARLLRSRLEPRREAFALTALPEPGFPEEPEAADVNAWARVQRARVLDRPTGPDYVEPITQLRRGGCDETVVACVASFLRRWVVAIAQDRKAGNGRIAAGGYRRARRAIAYASRFGLPIVTLIDTPGADPSAGSEDDGIASEISETFEALLNAPVPTVAVVVGEGGSGGALALAACDRLLILENAIFSVIGPEGAAAILRRDDIESVASDLQLTAHDLRDAGLADRVLPEDGEPPNRVVLRAVNAALDELAQESVPTDRRFERWRVLR